MAYDAWLSGWRAAWRQGEHVALVGPTGSGKTYVAHDMLSARRYVLVLAVKPKDDTIQVFTHGEPKYKRVKKWPLDWGVHRAVIEVKPDSLSDRSQTQRVYTIMNDVWRDHNWTLFLDDAGYMTGTLGLKRPLVVLLNQSRSLGVSIMTAATQATSIAAAIPSETLRQVRHIALWRFEDMRDIEACAHIIGMDKRALAESMRALRVYPDSSTDFLVYRRGYGLALVRQRPRGKG